MEKYQHPKFEGSPNAYLHVSHSIQGLYSSYTYPSFSHLIAFHNWLRADHECCIPADHWKESVAAGGLHQEEVTAKRDVLMFVQLVEYVLNIHISRHLWRQTKG